MSRALRAGVQQAEAIIEMVNLMYQDRTADNFYRGLMERLRVELNERKG